MTDAQQGPTLKASVSLRKTRSIIGWENKDNNTSPNAVLPSRKTRSMIG